MKLFVWDLHGVLEVGNERAVIDISNEVLSRFDYAERFDYDAGKRLYGRKWFEYFSWLLPGESHQRHLQLQEACFEVSERQPEFQYKRVKPTRHSRKVLGRIAGEHEQILISNTRTATLQVFLKLLGLDPFFGDHNSFAVDQHVQTARRTKHDVLSEYLAPGRSYDEIVIIGDSPSDIRLTQVAGGVTYLYTHPGFEFRECASDFRIRDLRKILAHV